MDKRTGARWGAAVFLGVLAAGAASAQQDAPAQQGVDDTTTTQQQQTGDTATQQQQGGATNQNTPPPSAVQNRGANQTRPDGVGDITIRKVGPTQNMMVNGRPVNRDMTARMVRGTVMVPIRFVSEYLGGQVEWEPRQRQVRILQGRRNMTMNVGTTRGTVNGEGRALSAAPVIAGGRTLVPLQEIARFFNADVRYNASTRTVFVNTLGMGAPATAGEGGGGAGLTGGDGSGQGGGTVTGAPGSGAGGAGNSGAGGSSGSGAGGAGTSSGSEGSGNTDSGAGGAGGSSTQPGGSGNP